MTPTNLTIFVIFWWIVVLLQKGINPQTLSRWIIAIYNANPIHLQFRIYCFILFKIYKLFGNLQGTNSTEIFDGLSEEAGHCVTTAPLLRNSNNRLELNDSTLWSLIVACKRRMQWIFWDPRVIVIHEDDTIFREQNVNLPTAFPW